MAHPTLLPICALSAGRRGPQGGLLKIKTTQGEVGHRRQSLNVGPGVGSTKEAVFWINFLIKIAKNGDKILAIFCSWNGGLGLARFRPSSVRRVPKTRIFRIAKKSQVAKKNVTADDGGGCVSPRPTARYPSPRPGPTPSTAKSRSREKW